MKKLLFLIAASLSAITVMAQNPAKQPMQQQKPVAMSQQPYLSNTSLSEQKTNRPWVIIGNQEEYLSQDRVPSPPGPNSPVKIIYYEYK